MKSGKYFEIHKIKSEKEFYKKMYCTQKRFLKQFGSENLITITGSAPVAYPTRVKYYIGEYPPDSTDNCDCVYVYRIEDLDNPPMIVSATINNNIID